MEKSADEAFEDAQDVGGAAKDELLEDEDEEEVEEDEDEEDEEYDDDEDEE